MLISYLCSLMQVVYYVFAVFGIWLFEGAIKPPPGMRYSMKLYAQKNTQQIEPKKEQSSWGEAKKAGLVTTGYL